MPTVGLVLLLVQYLHHSIYLFTVFIYLVFTVFSIYTLSGRTGSALVWHSEGRTIEALSVQ